MKTLAIEMSAIEASVAVLNGNVLLAQERWTQQRDSGQTLLANLTLLLEKASWNWPDIELYAVGTGPGNYSSLRMSMTVTRALALPLQTSIHAVTSGEALAKEIIEQSPGRLVVTGDARRGKIWYAIFAGNSEDYHVEQGWSLAEPEALQLLLTPETRLVSPEWERIRDISSSPLAECAICEKESVYPQAYYVGLLAQQQKENAQPSEPLTPLYLQPPVAIRPSR